MDEFVNAKGFKAKLNVVLSHMERNAKSIERRGQRKV